jgi:type VI secretion system protein ImpM
LQENLASLRQTMGAHWNERYLSAPIWRFTLPAGHAGQTAMCGVVMASVDRVCRQYPLTLAAPAPQAATAGLHLSNAPLFEQLEDIALSALDDDTDRAKVEAALAPLRLATPASSALNHRCFLGQSDPAPSIAAHFLATSYGQTGIWSTALDQDHRMMFCQALPTTGEFAALFDLAAPFWQPADGVGVP